MKNSHDKELEEDKLKDFSLKSNINAVKLDDLIKTFNKKFIITKSNVILETDISNFIKIPEIKSDFFNYIYSNVMCKTIFDVFLENTKCLCRNKEMIHLIQNNLKKIKFFWYGFEFSSAASSIFKSLKLGWNMVKVDPFITYKIKSKQHDKWLKNLHVIFIFSQDNNFENFKVFDIGYFVLIRGDLKWKSDI